MASMKFAHGCMPVLLHGKKPCGDLLWLLLCGLAVLSLSPASVRGEDTCIVRPGSLPLPYGWNCIFNERGTNQIDIWSPWYEEASFINAYIKAIRTISAKSPSFKFIFTIKSWGGNAQGVPAYRDELTTALRSNTEDAPELFAIGTRQLGYLQGEGLLKDISKRWTGVDEKLKAEVIPNIKQLWGPDDVWYSIPISTDTMILVYNKDAFVQQNVSFPPFQIKWEELFSLAERVNNTKTGKWGFGLSESNAYSSRIIFPLVYSYSQDAKLLNSTQCTFNTPANIQAIQKFADMWIGTERVAGPTAGCNDSSTDMPKDALIEPKGGAAMMILPAGIYSLLTDSGANLGVSALDHAFLGGTGLSVNSKVNDALLDVVFDIITEFVNPANEILTMIATDTFNPPPIFSKESELTNTPPWNITNSSHNAAFLGVSFGVDYVHPNYSLPYTYEIEQRGLFRCMLADIIEKRKTVSDAVADLCTAVNIIIKHSRPTPPASKRTKKGSKTWIIVGVPVAAVALIGALGALYWVYRYHPSYIRLTPGCTFFKDDSDRRHSATQKQLFSGKAISNTRQFTNKELVIATQNFSEKNKLGEGGFGAVYSGTLPTGVRLAVKKLKAMSYDHTEEFVNEVTIISAVRHKNLVGLLGYCIEGGNLMLAYELMPNGSLEDALFGKKKRVLTWQRCYDILNGTAEGISYLHTGCEQRIIHRDIKPANILLDANLRARVSDFGMAKDTDVEATHVTTRIMGTLGYLDPSYGRTGQLTEKSDVYSFGMVILVSLLGRKPFDSEVIKATSGVEDVVVILSEWVQCVGEGVLQRVESRFPKDYNHEEATMCLLVALLCIQMHQEQRPTMGQVVQMLKGEMAIPKLPLKEMTAISIIDYKNVSLSGSPSASASGETSKSAGAFKSPMRLQAQGSDQSQPTFSDIFSAITPR